MAATTATQPQRTAPAPAAATAAADAPPALPPQHNDNGGGNDANGTGDGGEGNGGGDDDDDAAVAAAAAVVKASTDDVLAVFAAEDEYLNLNGSDAAPAPNPAASTPTTTTATATATAGARTATTAAPIPGVLTQEQEERIMLAWYGPAPPPAPGGAVPPPPPPPAAPTPLALAGPGPAGFGPGGPGHHGASAPKGGMANGKPKMDGPYGAEADPSMPSSSSSLNAGGRQGLSRRAAAHRQAAAFDGHSTVDGPSEDSKASATGPSSRRRVSRPRASNTHNSKTNGARKAGKGKGKAQQAGSELENDDDSQDYEREEDDSEADAPPPHTLLAARAYEGMTEEQRLAEQVRLREVLAQRLDEGNQESRHIRVARTYFISDPNTTLILHPDPCTLCTKSRATPSACIVAVGRVKCALCTSKGESCSLGSVRSSAKRKRAAAFERQSKRRREDLRAAWEGVRETLVREARAEGHEGLARRIGELMEGMIRETYAATEPGRGVHEGGGLGVGVGACPGTGTGTAQGQGLGMGTVMGPLGLAGSSTAAAGPATFAQGAPHVESGYASTATAGGAGDGVSNGVGTSNPPAGG